MILLIVGLHFCKKGLTFLLIIITDPSLDLGRDPFRTIAYAMSFLWHHFMGIERLAEVLPAVVRWVAADAVRG